MNGSMKITVKLFAGVRELAGQSEVVAELARGATIGDLRKCLNNDFPRLGPYLSHAMFAIDSEYATDDLLVQEQSEIACIPPVSGG